jgi:hypothetical protein
VLVSHQTPPSSSFALRFELVEHRLAGRDHALFVGEVLTGEGGREEVGVGLADRRRRVGEPEELGGRPVDPEEAGGGVLEVDGVRQGVDHGLEEVALAGQLGLDPLPAGDVADDGEIEGRVRHGVGDRRSADLDDERRPVAAAGRQLDRRRGRGLGGRTGPAARDPVRRIGDGGRDGGAGRGRAGDEVGQETADRLGRRPAEEALGAGVPENDLTGRRVADDDRVGDRPEEAPDAQVGGRRPGPVLGRRCQPDRRPPLAVVRRRHRAPPAVPNRAPV